MNRKKHWTIISCLFACLLIIQACDDRQSLTWTKSPVDELIKAHTQEQNFSIILYDMDARDKKYFHKYNVVIEKADTVLSSISEDWLEVPPSYFEKNVDNMGMEIASKKDGVLSKTASPAGYNHYVGNSRYGRWQHNSDGSSFWAFYGRYAFMSSMFNMMHSPARRSYYDQYQQGSYYGSRPYYGPSNTNRTYGTQAYTASQQGKKSNWGAKPSTFKQSVRSQVKRSSTQASSKKSRSSSRYGNSSNSSRSRSSGGFGK